MQRVSESDTIALEAARRGAEYLDEHVPDWRERVSPEDLDMGSDCCCILGQLYGDYHEGRHALQHELSYGDVIRWASRHGFAIADLPHWVGYCHLQDAWLELLAPKG